MVARAGQGAGGGRARGCKAGEPQVFRLFGYAGTGKTTLARHVAEDVDGEVVFAAFTGKAAHVMRGKGCATPRTIHSLIYRMRGEDEDGPTFVLNDDSAAGKAALIVIDECSMVDDEIGRDLLSFGKPVLVLGDPAQLPPIAGGGFFTDAEPDVMLTEVHRQAADDPIIRLSMIVREGGALEDGRYRREPRRSARDEIEPEEVLARRPGAGRAQQHAARATTAASASSSNARARCRSPATSWSASATTASAGSSTAASGMSSAARKPRKALLRYTLSPEEGEEGKRRTVVSINPAFFDGTAEALTNAERRRSDEFDFGYVLTVHKAQGSQWDDVMLFDESFAFREHGRRWLYTGITRAVRRVTVVR